MSSRRRIAATLLLMVLGYSGILIASATESTIPLFVAALPLALVPFALWGREPPREGPGDEAPGPSEAG